MLNELGLITADVPTILSELYQMCKKVSEDRNCLSKEALRKAKPYLELKMDSLTLAVLK